MKPVFSDPSTIAELSRLASELQITDSHIVFRDQEYPATKQTQAALLCNLLYAECYALKTVFQQERIQRSAPTEADPALVQQLSAANQSRERTEPGWIVKSMPAPTHAEVTRNNITRTIPVEFIRNQGQPPVAGQQVEVYFPKEDHNTAAGFYYAFSNRTISMDEKLLRVYWNIDSRGAAALVSLITATLNHYRMPFIFKCLNHPNLYSRRDAAVLYVEENSCGLLGMLLPGLCNSMSDYLHEDVPLFTHWYHKGVGIAESPGIYESFGMHRARLVTEALLHEPALAQNPEQLIEQVAKSFIRNAIDPAQPHLNNGTKKLVL